MIKKKILIFFDNRSRDIEKSLINLLKNLNSKKYTIDLILEENNEYLKKNISKKINVIEAKTQIKILKKVYTIFNKIKFRLKNYHKYDCAITYTPDSHNSTYYVRTASKNKVMFIHNDYTNIYNEEEFRNFFTSRDIYEFTNLVFLTNESKDNFLKYYPSLSKKTHVINNLINYEEIEKKCNEKISEKIKQTDTNLLLIAPLIEENERISVQLKLVKDLKKDIPNLKLFIIGDGIDRVAYESYIDDNNLQDNIFILGNKSNPYPYLKKIDYLLLTSNNKCYSLILESFLLNSAVISLNKISDDLFEIGKTHGFLISKQFNKMQEEIKNILKNKKQKKHKLDFKQINKEKIAKIEKIIDINN